MKTEGFASLITMLCSSGEKHKLRWKQHLFDMYKSEKLYSRVWQSMCKMNGKKLSLNKGSASNHVLWEVAHTVANQARWETECCSLPLLVGILEHLGAGIARLHPTQNYRLTLVCLHVRLERVGEVSKGLPLESFDAENLSRFQASTLLLAPSYNHTSH